MAWSMGTEQMNERRATMNKRADEVKGFPCTHLTISWTHSNVSMFFFKMAKRDQFPASSHFIYKSVRLLTNFGFSGVCEGKRTISPVVFYPNTLAVDG